MPALLPAQMTVTFATTPPCDNDGTITATVTGGTPPYSYNWYLSDPFGLNLSCNPYPNSSTLTGLPNMGASSFGQGPLYALEVTDAMGNISAPNLVQLPPTLWGYPSVIPAHCPANDGEVTPQMMVGTPPYSYSWMNGDTTATLTGLGTGDMYDVQVTDANGCTFRLTDFDSICAGLTMRGISIMYLSIASTPANCLNGTATVNVLSGGTAPYNYSWFNGQTAQTATNLTANQACFVEVTDVDGCSQQGYAYISSLTTITGTLSTTPANCLDGTATVNNIAGGTAPYSYLWSNGQTTPTATNLVAFHSYYVTITDSNSCVKNFSTNIPTNSTLQAITSSTPETCINGNGAASMTAISGVIPYIFSWSNGQTTATIDSLSQGFYVGIVTDADGCAITSYVSVQQYIPVLPNPTVIGSACNAPTGSVTLAPTGGTAPYTYYWNTNPPQTTATATNLGIGTYSYTISDTAGCIKNGTVSVADNSNMGVNVSVTPNVCFNNNGTAQANVIGGINPYNYVWSNGAGSQTISGLGAGWKRVIVTDSTGCMRKDSDFVANFTPVNLNIIHTNASCIYVNDGTATAFASGGTPPYTYLWSNGATTSSISNILSHYYSVTVTDATGCSQYNNEYVGYNTTSGCSVSIFGNIFDDQIQDCVQAIGEPNLANIMVNCSPNGGYDFTDANGNYSFEGLPPGNYSLTQSNAYITQLCSAGAINVSLPVGGMASTGNTFADSFNVVKDLAIYGFNAPNIPVTGNPYTNTIHVDNYGSVAQNPVITCVHDANITFTGASPSPTSYNALTHTITWNLATLNAFNGNSMNIQVHYIVPPTTVFGTVLAFILQVTPNANDVSPQNNLYVYNTTVVSSYDPNYIEVFPKGEGVLGLISQEDSVLHYVIHFQNTGTWAAKTVAIRQPLDGNLRISSVELGASSHLYKANITPENTLVFTFNDINLPDSASNEPESHGFVAYTVHLKPDLDAGTEITEKADIYFDYNTPVATNEVLNTIRFPQTYSAPNVLIYPNPAQDIVHLQIKDFSYELVSIDISDLLGTSLYNYVLLTDGKGLSINLNTSHLANGMYILKMNNLTEKVSRKLVIAR